MLKKLKEKKLDLKWGDFVIVGAILVIALALWINLVLGFGSDNNSAEIVHKGQVLAQYNLESGAKEYEIENITEYIEDFKEESHDDEVIIHISSQGIHFDLMIKDGKIRFANSDCPDQVCVNTGDIYRNGEVAVCLPSEIIVRVVGKGTESDPDIIIG